ncbi:hypothetical protein C2G38_2218230 [Gigaspora rosea]|uniref:RRM domain-containing protein n=1 Tax=Gigaspora rosea TaxID=44941 RepID=A0A397U6U0_9GLOM|nr:hypothetical protein C2G38_2218230 [Gigaspora rosea]
MTSTFKDYNYYFDKIFKNTSPHKSRRRAEMGNSAAIYSFIPVPMILTPKENFDKFYEEHIKFLQREKKRIEDFFREDGISGEYLTDQIEGIGNIIKEFTKGQVTDAKIIRTAKEANGALNYFNNTFIFTSRITVEHSKPVCDPALPRPWSAHSVGSSKYQKNHFQKSDLPNKNNLIVENDSNESNDLTKNKIDKLFNDELSKESSVSDMVWVRSKMRRRLDIDADDINDNDIDIYKVNLCSNTSSENDYSENKLDQMKSMTSHNETDVNKSGKPTEVPPEEPLMKLVHIPLDKKTKNQKGFAYVLYHIPEHVVKAYIELDNKFFMGRLLRILPSKDELQIRDLDPSKWSLNESRFNVKKNQPFWTESDNMAAKLALAETHNGISLNSFGKKEKSDTVILVKNIPFGVSKDELLQLFGWYGEIGPSIEFLQPSEARNSFTNLAYKKFKGVPLYLEKAPLGVFKSEVDPSSNQTDNDAKKVLSSSDIIENTINEEEESSEVTATLFIKNINFNTTTEELNKVFKSTSGMKSAKIKMKNDPKNSGKKLSMGFGFVEYDNMKNAKNALKAMQGYMLDGHSLQLKFSNHGLDMVQRKRKEDEITKKKKRFQTKIIVNNVAFETTKKRIERII